ncbi:E3 ubiquitin-protein ligase ATL4 [Vitis vinifera]|uniref:E3 ubiquitin-protein ligase ATL4 n=1 Tax=Vitis vinifera TaxID=29760 RepID=A0A438CB83_VITVI|nr:E3 ubiquitin-protein ligase ATL4 [Vitis vinifera]
MTDACPAPAWFPGIFPDEGVTRENSSSSSPRRVSALAAFRRCSERLHSDDVVLPPVDSDRRFSSRRVSPEDLSLMILCLSSLSALSGAATHPPKAIAPCVSPNVSSVSISDIRDGADFMKAILASTNAGDSFRIELGSVSRRRSASESGEARRSYSVGSFDYIVDHESELLWPPPIDEEALRVAQRKKTRMTPELSSTASLSISSRALSFRSSGRFFTGSSRRNETASVGDWDLEANRVGEEISEMFRWFSGYNGNFGP